jgi:hypothetical protein
MLKWHSPCRFADVPDPSPSTFNLLILTLLIPNFQALLITPIFPLLIEQDVISPLNTLESGVTSGWHRISRFLIKDCLCMRLET